MSTRDYNKQKRRKRILHAAKELLIAGGYDALTTRKLAEDAGVTVPTIYNLIGGKDEVLKALLSESVERAWELVDFPTDRPTLAIAENVVESCIKVISEDVESSRATIIASDRVVGAYSAAGDLSAARSSAGLKAVDIATGAARAMQASGVLQGKISAQTLGEQVFTSFRDPLRDWAYGLTSLAEFRRRVMRGVFMVMCSDASETVRHELVARINELESRGGSRGKRAARGG